MQYTDSSKVEKTETFQLKNFDTFLIFAQNIDCGYKLELPHRGGSNKYPLCFRAKVRKIGTPLYPAFTI